MMKFMDVKTIANQFYNALAIICDEKGLDSTDLEDMEYLCKELGITPADADKMMAFINEWD